ncbi:hypothetical protein KKB64_01395 [Patescibacteria group bacterium]|nr:hypothetical protein [Patescibacteria group bacterium]MBU1472425.1 hypothetical protein [Patescibacteria group bacterium]MBU2460240.1 hypothetical protein [Patescibacteria group bacterium]MBU2544555.1 hypothetical protein [Patescibacteria group bacterium]
MQKKGINLLQKSKPLSPAWGLWESNLRKVSIVCLIITLLLSGSVGGYLFILVRQYRSLDEQKTLLLQQIAENGQKEGLLTSFLQRLNSIRKVYATMKSRAVVLDTIDAIGSSTLPTSLSLDEGGKVAARFTAGRLEDAIDMVANIMASVDQKNIRQPFLDSLSLEEDGSVNMSVSFYQVYDH